MATVIADLCAMKLTAGSWSCRGRRGTSSTSLGGLDVDPLPGAVRDPLWLDDLSERHDGG
jgi:hypothetical protein